MFAYFQVWNIAAVAHAFGKTKGFDLLLIRRPMAVSDNREPGAGNSGANPRKCVQQDMKPLGERKSPRIQKVRIEPFALSVFREEPLGIDSAINNPDLLLWDF